MSIASRLYNGEVSYDFTGRRKRWYTVSGVVLTISLLSIIFRGFNYGIEFKGGVSYELPRSGHTLADARGLLTQEGIVDPVVQSLGSDRLRITTPALTPAQTTATQDALAARFGISTTQVSTSSVGSSWGSEISKKALEGLLIFLVAVTAYIAVRFRERGMAIAAFVALVHDLVITAGVYSLVGFEVTPSTVIALLTILGFSLYDTVVVFDKVRENTAGLQSAGRATYTQQANLALNQTLVRSLNTSLIALVPVASLLFVGAGLLGAGTLKDLALAQLVGLASGAYSSIFIATPLLCQIKEREPQMKALAARVGRLESAGRLSPLGRRPAYAAVGGPGADEPTGSAVVPSSVADTAPDARGAFSGRPTTRPAGRPGSRGRNRPHGARRR